MDEQNRSLQITNVEPLSLNFVYLRQAIQGLQMSLWAKNEEIRRLKEFKKYATHLIQSLPTRVRKEENEKDIRQDR